MPRPEGVKVCRECGKPAGPRWKRRATDGAVLCPPCAKREEK